jgi:hypothetical protein
MALMESPVTMDMMTCLAQICRVYAAADQDVAKVRDRTCLIAWTDFSCIRW